MYDQYLFLNKVTTEDYMTVFLRQHLVLSYSRSNIAYQTSSQILIQVEGYFRQRSQGSRIKVTKDKNIKEYSRSRTKRKFSKVLSIGLYHVDLSRLAMRKHIQTHLKIKTASVVQLNPLAPTPQNGKKFLSVFDHFVGLALKELTSFKFIMDCCNNYNNKTY